MSINIPSLFGINRSNRDFLQSDSWGKNQFNSSFPASLACYMNHMNINPVYLKLDEHLSISNTEISVAELFGISAESRDLFFSFESPFTPYQQLLIGNLPRIDLVTQNRDSGNCLTGLEIKLTALPDHTTCSLADDQFGSELVIRPDTIVYLACSIAIKYRNNLQELVNIIGDDFDAIADWTEPSNVIHYIPEMVNVIKTIFVSDITGQQPLVMQPVWKTRGKSPELAENCLDIFVWSNFAFSRLFLDSANNGITSISRHIRTIIWLFKMLFDFSKNGQFNHQRIIDTLSYNTKNDKAFSVNGIVTHPYMRCDRLTLPSITKDEIKHIILGGGQTLLSPERRFDAIIYNSPELFN